MSVREEILNAADLPKEQVIIPEWPHLTEALWVWGLSAAERDEFEVSCVEEKRVGGRTITKANLQNLRAKLAVRSLRLTDGKRVFEDADAEALGKKSAMAVNRIFEIAQRLNGITDEDMEDLAKNSGRGQRDSSATGLAAS